MAFYRETPRNAVPPYLQGLIGEPSSTGKSESTETRASFQRPQDYPTLESMFKLSQGTAPGLLAGVGGTALRNIFTNAVRANQQMARESVSARRGARGLAPLSTGVSQQHEAAAMMPLQTKIAELEALDAFELAREKRIATEKGLAALFAASSGPVSEDRTTRTSRQEQLATRPLPDTMPEVRYPTQSMGAAGGGGGGGGRGGGGGGLGGSDFWSKPFDPFGGWKDIGGMRGEYDRRASAEYDEQARREAKIWEREFEGGRTSSPSLPGGGSPGGYAPTGTGLGGPGVWGDDAPGAFPAQPSGEDEWEQVQGGSGAGAFMARRRKGETGAYSRF